MNTTFTARARPTLLGTVAAAAVALSACGGDPAPISGAAAAADAPPPAVSSAETEPTNSPPASPDAAVKISQTALGDVLADAGGMTLYAFTNDVEAQSTCSGTCAEAWPPVIVDPDFIVSPGLDSGIFATTIRDDGSHQLVAGKWPLYRFAADSKPGDITGQGSGDVWYVVDLAGRIIETPAPPQAAAAPIEPEPAESPAANEPAAESAGSADPYGSDGSNDGPEPTELVDVGSQIQLIDTDLGPVVADAEGFVLYLFLPDEAGAPTCVGGCAGVWPPLLVEGGVALAAGDGIDSSLLSRVDHPDGGQQLKLGTWPLYFFAGDEAPGQTAGQGSGGEWFVIGADGKPIN